MGGQPLPLGFIVTLKRRETAERREEVREGEGKRKREREEFLA